MLGLIVAASAVAGVLLLGVFLRGRKVREARKVFIGAAALSLAMVAA
jgi:hypothetical protein